MKVTDRATWIHASHCRKVQDDFSPSVYQQTIDNQQGQTATADKQLTAKVNQSLTKCGLYRVNTV